MPAAGDDFRDHVARLRDQYDAFYESGDIAHYSPRLTRAFLEVLLGRARVPKGGRVLDLGCGAGYYSAQLHRLGFRVVGIDISETAIARAKGAFPEIEFRVADALALEDDLPPFDAVFMMGFSLLNTRSLESIQSVIHRVADYLAPGGALLLNFGSDLTGRASGESDWINHGREDLRRFVARPDLTVDGPYLTHMRLIHLIRGAAINPVVSGILSVAPAGLRRLVVYCIRSPRDGAPTRS